MNQLGLFAHTPKFAPGIFEVRRRTWIGIGVSLLVFFALLIWAALALIGWIWGQTQSLASTAPQALQGAARSTLEQAKGIIPGVQGMLDQVTESVPGVQRVFERVKDSAPGAREKLAELVPALTPEVLLQRDVSGEDLGPVVRPTGLTRTQWQRTGGSAAVDYEGKADYVMVLDHYAKGFAAQGFAQKINSATQNAEMHEYTKGPERFLLKITQKSKSLVLVRIETVQQ